MTLGSSVISEAASGPFVGDDAHYTLDQETVNRVKRLAGESAVV
jgi:hypothetical protein